MNGTPYEQCLSQIYKLQTGLDWDYDIDSFQLNIFSFKGS